MSLLTTGPYVTLTTADKKVGSFSSIYFSWLALCTCGDLGAAGQDIGFGSPKTFLRNLMSWGPAWVNPQNSVYTASFLQILADQAQVLQAKTLPKRFESKWAGCKQLCIIAQLTKSLSVIDIARLHNTVIWKQYRNQECNGAIHNTHQHELCWILQL